MRYGRKKQAFTLLELLVVMAIIAALVGILVPAVQKARAAAARAQCSNNIRQLGIGYQHYIELNGKLPHNGDYRWSSAGITMPNSWSGLARFLPLIEQDSMFRAINFDNGYWTQIEITSKRLPVFMCPAETNDRGNGFDAVYGNQYWPANYALNLGTWQVLSNKVGSMQTGDGAFSPNRSNRPGDFADGMSNTLGLSEAKAYTPRLLSDFEKRLYATVPPIPQKPEDFAMFTPGPVDEESLGHACWSVGQVIQTGFTTVFRPNTRVVYPPGPEGKDVDFVTAVETQPGDTFAAVTARSFHSGGVNVLMMDGSARFVSDGIDLTAWRALGTRAGGETVPPP